MWPAEASLCYQAVWPDQAQGWLQASSQQALAGGGWNHPESSSVLWPLCWPHTLTPSWLPPSPQRGQTTTRDVSRPPYSRPSPKHLYMPRLELLWEAGGSQDDRRVGRGGALAWDAAWMGWEF